jgi:hypothetical protein
MPTQAVTVSATPAASNDSRTPDLYLKVGRQNTLVGKWRLAASKMWESEYYTDSRNLLLQPPATNNPQQRCAVHSGTIAVTSISTRARSSISAPTCTALMAG